MDQGLAGVAPRWYMHFIPTHSSWVNQVERFFSTITNKAIRRGSFASVKELVAKIEHSVAHYNTTTTTTCCYCLLRSDHSTNERDLND